MERMNFMLKYGDAAMKNTEADHFIGNINHPILTYSERKLFYSPDFPPEKHHDLLDKLGDKIRHSTIDSILAHPDIDPTVIHKIASKHDDPGIHRLIALHHKTSPTTLELLYNHAPENPDVQRYVADNILTPKHILSKLIRHDHPDVRFNAISNPLTETSDLEYAKNDPRNAVHIQWKASDAVKKGKGYE